MIEPAKLLQLYDRGVLARGEMLMRLLQAATEHSPAEIAALLPPDWLAKVRERVAAPPASPDQCRVISTVSFHPADRDKAFRQESQRLYDERCREESQRLYDGLWIWHRYFESSPHPPTSH